MSFFAFMSNVTFWREGEAWSSFPPPPPPGEPPVVITWFDDDESADANENGDNDEIDAITQALDDLYHSSSGMASWMDELVGNLTELLISRSTSDAGVAFGTQVTLNLAMIGQLRAFNENGELFTLDPRVVIAHELKHLEGFGDPDSLNESAMNGENYDQTGDAVRFENDVAGLLGIDDRRVSYGAAFSTAGVRYQTLQEGVSYSDNNVVNVVRFGSADVADGDFIDHENNTTNTLDLIFGFHGDDTIFSGRGRDYVYGGGGVDHIVGGSGDDVLYGDGRLGDDVVDGDGDFIFGGEGSDTLIGGEGGDTIDGGAGFDTVSFADQTSVVLDLVTPSNSSGDIQGDEYLNIEQFSLTNGEDVFVGAAEDDRVLGGGGDDVMDGGDGDDRLFGEGGEDVLTGGDDIDHLFGGSENDVLSGGVGNDWLDGGNGDDVLLAGNGIDTLRGGAGIDQLHGQDDGDFLFAIGPEGDSLFGGDGGDVLVALGGSAHLYGDDGITGGSAVADGDRDVFVGGGGNVFVHDADADDVVYVAGLQVFGGVQQAWMEGGVAAWSPFGSLFGVMPLPSANLLFALTSAFIDTPSAGFLQFGLTETNQLLISIAGGRAGAIVMEDYALDVETGAASGNVVAFRQVRTEADASISSLTQYLNLALRAGFGHCLIGIDPLIIDLDGDGIELSGSASTYFDLNGDGFAERAVWTRGGDGFLVRDINANGQIDNVSEMFGNADTPGFTALAALDSNSDGKITAADAAFGDLRVWVDADGDGVTDAGELKTLAELNITEISAISTSPDVASVRGNTVRADATVTFGDGTIRAIADVLLGANSADTRWLGDNTISTPAAALPALSGFGTVVDLRVQMTDDASLLAAVDDFAALSASTSWSDLRADAKDLLMRWAGVDGVTPTSLGPDFDAQQLAFLERWLGTELVPRDGGGNPVVASAAELVEAWNAALDAAAVRLAAQGPLASLFEDFSYNVDTDRLEAETPTALADLLEAVFALLPGTAPAALAAWDDHWAPMLAALNDAMVRADKNLVRDDFVVMSLISAMEGQSQPLSLSELVEGLGLQNVVIGSAGADTLTRANATGAVVFVGGAGNDTMTGSAGQSIYVFGSNFGQDLIIDSDGGEMGDRIRFASHTVEDLSFSRSGNDLVISVIGTSDQITVRGHFVSNPLVADYGVEEIQFADGTLLDVREIAEFVGRGSAVGETITGTGQEDQIEGMGGNDTLRGGDGGDTYFFSAGHGQDTIEDIQTSPLHQTSDILVLEGGLAFEDLVISRVGGGDDLLISFAGSSDSILIVDQFAYNALGIRGGTLPEGFIGALLGGPFTGNGQLATDSRIEAIFFHSGGALSWTDIQRALIDQATTDGADTVYGFGTSDIFNASAGDDLFVGYDGGDAYMFGEGSGADTIHDQARYLTLLGTDAVLFGPGISLGDLTVTRIEGSDDLLIQIAGTGDSLTIVDQFDGQMMDLFGIYGVQWFSRVENFVFSNGQSLDWEDVLDIVTTGGAGADYLVGDFRADTLNGGAGNDYLNGADDGDTYVFGLGDGQDTIEDTPDFVVWQVADRLLFEAGIAVEDVVFFHDPASDDLIVSIAGTSDQITIRSQYDVTETGPYGAIAFNAIEIFEWADGTTIAWRDLIQIIIDDASSTGDDIIAGSHYDDTINGAAGADTLLGGNGSDTYVFELGGGADTVEDFASSTLADDEDVLAFGAGIEAGDIIFERDGDDITLHIAGTSDSVTLVGQFGYNSLSHRAYEIEQISFDGGPVWSAADLRANILVQASTAGADTIEGFWSQDTLNGGLGDDVLAGADGSDTYVFGAGFGDDTIEENVYNTFYNDHDTIVFSAGYISTDAIFSRSGDDLIISFTGSTDSVTIVGQFDHIAYFSSWTDIEAVVFGDSVTMSDADIRERLLEDARTAGADTIEGFFTADVLDGGAGNDTLIGRGGGDTYVFGVGSGQDTIQESFATVYEDRPDTVAFDATVDRADVTFTRVGDALVATIAGATDTLTIANHFLANGQGRVELFRFADGSTITAAQAEANAVASLSTPGNDTITGGSGADLLDGGAGNDLLRGAGGNDTYVFGRNYGQDRIEENGGSSGSPEDRVVFGEGVELSDLIFSRSGNDLIIQIAGTSDQLVIDEQFYSASSTGAWSRYRVDSFQFADGAILSAGEVDALTLAAHQTAGNDTIIAYDTDDTLNGGAGADFLQGNGGNDTYVFGPGYGNDVINETTETHGDLEDTIVFSSGVAPSDLILSRSGDHAVITLAASGETLTIQYQFRSANSSLVDGADRIERFVFSDGTVWTATDFENFTIAAQQTAGNDAVYGYNRPDLIDAGAGNDTMQGNGGDDTYVFGRGYGQDTITETSETHGSLNDTIVFGPDIAPEDIVLSRSGSDLILQIEGTTDQLTVRYQFLSSDSSSVNGNDRIENFVFADGSVWTARDVELLTLNQSSTAGDDTIIAYGAADVLDGGAGNDFLQGNGSSDVYIWGRGYGQDVIDETNDTYGATGDTIRFTTGVAPADLLLSRDGHDLIIAIAGTSDQLRIELQLWSTNSETAFGAHRIENFVFADGTVWTAAEMDARVLLSEATGNTDVIAGLDGADRIEGLGGNDTLDGKGGNDHLIGGAGDDALVGGAGADLLDGGAGSDTVNYSSASIVTINLTTGVHGGDATGDVFVSVENVIGAANGDSITGDAGNNRIDGEDGADALYGAEGDDTLIGGKLADALDGGEGNDTASYGTTTGAVVVNLANAAANTGWAAGDTFVSIENLTGTNYADTLTGDAQANVLDGGASNDTLIGAAGADTLAGGDGTDVASYATAAAGVIANLSNALVNTGDAAGDAYTSIESLTGSVYADTLIGAAGVNTLDGGNGDDLLIGAGGADVLVGGAGSDTASYATGLAAIVVSLTSTSGSAGDAQGDTFNSVENLIGSDFADTMTGSTAANVMNGGAGDDTLIGAAGADQLIGGDGIDTASYIGAGVTASLAAPGSNTGDAAGDTYSGIENLSGSSSADTLTGDGGANTLSGWNGADTLNGGDGDDFLYGGSSGDVLNGGNGDDTVIYTLGSSLTINLTTAANTGSEASGDSYSSIENVISGAGGDTITGTSGANRLDGGGGNDTLIGAAGADQLIGGDGADTASYANAGAGVTADLTTAANNTGDAQGDTYSGIERLTGSTYADTLGGDSSVNTLDGGNGDDVLIGGAGADVLTGGAGADTASYATAAAGVTANLASAGSNTGDAAGDTYSSIESLIGSGYDDTLTGTTAANTLNGGAGADVLYGAAGLDTLTGGAGADRFVYTASSETTVGANADRILDFSQGDDVIDLSAIDANTTLSGNQDFSFIGASAFSNVAGQLRAVQVGADIHIFGDTNGDGTADFQIILASSSVSLGAGDFWP